eukprot:COSAG05_NODE_5728_length_1104_cov_2.043781_1_plen_343_part_10
MPLMPLPPVRMILIMAVVPGALTREHEGAPAGNRVAQDEVTAFCTRMLDAEGCAHVIARTTRATTVRDVCPDYCALREELEPEPEPETGSELEGQYCCGDACCGQAYPCFHEEHAPFLSLTIDFGAKQHEQFHVSIRVGADTCAGMATVHENSLQLTGECANFLEQHSIEEVEVDGEELTVKTKDKHAGSQKQRLVATAAAKIQLHHCEKEEEDGEEDLERTPKFANVICLTIVGLVFLTIMFETSKEFLQDYVGPEVQNLVSSLYGELTILGFIGLCSFLMVNWGWAGRLSIYIFIGDKKQCPSAPHSPHGTRQLVGDIVQQMNESHNPTASADDCMEAEEY